MTIGAWVFLWYVGWATLVVLLAGDHLAAWDASDAAMDAEIARAMREEESRQ